MYLAPQFLEVGYSRSSHPHYKVLIFRVYPLSRVAITCSLVFRTLISRPTDPRLVYGYSLSVSTYRIAVVKKCPREHSTGTSNSIRIQRYPCPAHSRTNLCVCYIGSAYFCFGLADRYTCQLLVTFGLDEQTLILVKILQLIHDIDGWLESCRYIERHTACSTRLTSIFSRRKVLYVDNLN